MLTELQSDRSASTRPSRKSRTQVVAALVVIMAPALPAATAEPIGHEILETVWGTADQARGVLVDAGADACFASTAGSEVGCAPYAFSWTSQESDNCQVAIANADTGRLRVYNPWTVQCFDAATVGDIWEVPSQGWYVMGHGFTTKRVELHRSNRDQYNPSAGVEVGLANWDTGALVYSKTVQSYSFTSGDGDDKAWPTNPEGSAGASIKLLTYLSPGTYVQFTYVVAGSPQNTPSHREWAVLDVNADWMTHVRCEVLDGWCLP